MKKKLHHPSNVSKLSNVLDAAPTAKGMNSVSGAELSHRANDTILYVDLQTDEGRNDESCMKTRRHEIRRFM